MWRGVKGRITAESNVVVYKFTTTSNAATAASVCAVVPSILDSRSTANLIVWTVAATMVQGLRFRGLPWVITPRQRGPMVRNGDHYEFRDPESGYVWKVSVEALEG